MFEDFPADALTVYIENHRHKKATTGTAYRKRLDDYNELNTTYRYKDRYEQANVRELETRHTLHDVSPALRFIFEIEAAEKPGRLCLHAFSVYVGCCHHLPDRPSRPSLNDSAVGY